jgi:hypothetical protein
MDELIDRRRLITAGATAAMVASATGIANAAHPDYPTATGARDQGLTDDFGNSATYSLLPRWTP